MEFTEFLKQYAPHSVIILYLIFSVAKKIFPIVKSFLKKIGSGSSQTTTTNVNITGIGTQPQAENQFQKYKESQCVMIDYRDLFKFLTDYTKILRMKHDLSVDILDEQTSYAKKHIQIVRIALTDVVLELLRDAGIEDTHYATYFSNFENFVDMCEGRIKDDFKEMCINNHFAEYTTYEFKGVIERNISILEGTLRDLLRKRYPQSQFINNFKKIFEVNLLIRTELKDCFEYAREVAIDKRKQFFNAKEEFDKKSLETVGMKYEI